MASTQPVNGLECCCPDCDTFEDHFDCCQGLGWDPGNFAPIEYCENTGENPEFTGSMACCFDQEHGLITLDTTDLRPAWEVESGEWHKGLSPDAQYDIYTSPCNDGALFADTAGALRCKIGWEQDGFVFMVDIVNEEVGTSVSFVFDDGPDSEGPATTVNYSVGAYDPMQGGNEVTVSLTNATETKSITVYHAPWNPMTPTGRYSLTIAVNGWQGLTCVSFGRAVTTLPPLYSCSAGVGKKFKIVNNGETAIFDNVYWAKQSVYPSRRDLPCPMCTKCTCDNPDGWYRIYGPWKLTIDATCENGPLDPTCFHLEIFLQTDEEHCQLTGNRWYTDPMTICGQEVYFEMNCIANGLNFKMYENGVPNNLSFISVPPPADCEDLITHVETNMATGIFSHGGGCLCLGPTETWTLEEVDGSVPTVFTDGCPDA